jgi:hypothetical protein
LAAVPLSGCATQPSSQTSVITNPPPIGLTPAQRGVIRREALTTAEAGFNAWLTADTKAMTPYFKPSYITYYDGLYAKYAKQGKKRVRKVEIKSMDVSDMNNTGRQALVDVQFVDRQYYTDLAGTPITKPANKATYVQLTLDKKSGKWLIDNMIATGDVLK